MGLYDSVTAANEPDGPDDLGAGYGDGLYNNWAQVQARFGTRAVLDVCVNPADQVGNCLDVETGDASPDDAPSWTARARARGVPIVWNYCNASTWPTVIAAFLDAGARLPDRWWIADYTDKPHFPQVTVRGVTYTADACQYAGGMTARFDSSCYRPGAFTTNPPAAPAPAVVAAPAPIPGEPFMQTRFQTPTGSDGTAYVDLPIPAGCTRLIGGFADVLDATAFTPPHHDGDVTPNSPTGVVCQPAVDGHGIRPGHQRLRLTGAIPNHTYTGTAIFG